MREQRLENTVMFTIATGGYIPFVLNLHASLKRVGMQDQLVAYSLDNTAHAELSAAGVRSSRYTADNVQLWSDCLTPQFERTMSFKYEVALDILKAGKNALYTDSDIVFLRNPIDYLRTVIAQSGADLVMQHELPKNAYNAGFWFARSTPSVIELFSDVRSALQASPPPGDQIVLNERLPLMRGIKTSALDADLFACGNRFLVSRERRASYADCSGRPFDADSAYMLHFNFLVGKEAKVLAMIRHNAVFHPSVAEYGRQMRHLGPRLRRALIHRARILREALPGQPVTKWPSLVISLLTRRGKVGL
jgi:hypothetical protein